MAVTYPPAQQSIAFSKTLVAILDEIMIMDMDISSTLNCKNYTCKDEINAHNMKLEKECLWFGNEMDLKINRTSVSKRDRTRQKHHLLEDDVVL